MAMLVDRTMLPLPVGCVFPPASAQAIISLNSDSPRTLPVAMVESQMAAQVDLNSVYHHRNLR